MEAVKRHWWRVNGRYIHRLDHEESVYGGLGAKQSAVRVVLSVHVQWKPI